MSVNLNKDKALIFRITHRDNLPWIFDNGLHASTGAKRDPNYRNIGNLDLIGRRSTRVVPVPPAGTLSDYIPFYFTPFSIMLLNIKTGYNVKKAPNEEIVILVSSLGQMAKSSAQFVFTNQHAYPPMAQYFTDVADLDKVDWTILQNRDFKQDPDDPAKKERYQAEALIWKAAPLDSLMAVCCYTEAVEAAVRNQLDQRQSQVATRVQKNWYF